MKKDIENRNDIEQLVDLFYEKVKQDKSISHFFINVVTVDWDKHLQNMYSFWENALFYSGNYAGNPMQQHFILNEKCPMSVKHFDQWIQLFNLSVDELFEGEQADIIRQRAQNISLVMQNKINK